MLRFLWKLFEAVEMDHENCERCKSLCADLDASNRLVKRQEETIEKQDKLILTQAEDLIKARQELVDALFYRDQYRRELQAIRTGINTTNAQE